MVEGKQVKETLSGFLGAEMVHLICIAAQAAENVFGSIGGDGDCPPFGQWHPLLLGTRQPFQCVLTALETSIEDQQTDTVFSQEGLHISYIRVLYFGCHANELIQTSGGCVNVTVAQPGARCFLGREN